MNQPSEDPCDIMAFPPKLMAEQLTLMDVERFSEVVPYDCLGSIWSQCNEKGKEHLAPTTHVTITQFNNVANCIIITCLMGHSMKAQDRARVVEHWIKVARECLVLRNFSVHAMLSALQSTSIHQMKRTWREVSRDDEPVVQASQSGDEVNEVHGVFRVLRTMMRTVIGVLRGSSPDAETRRGGQGARPRPRWRVSRLASNREPEPLEVVALHQLMDQISRVQGQGQGCNWVGTIKLATLEMNHQRVQMRQRQQKKLQALLPAGAPLPLGRRHPQGEEEQAQGSQAAATAFPAPPLTSP
ncbi:PREDICTED: uncharacterized protein LOC103607796, partial [Galeopterus variegatus]|uniref:Uncharacterized protein LOC103607796 n=1 Tax=Galeopterus variegatus TaxID=482537 RepID=A0ABM0SC94_GALVR